MRLVVGDVFTAIKEHTPKELAIVKNVCRARPAGYFHMPKYKSGHWDGYISLMRTFTTFPTGLLDIVCAALDDANVAYAVDVGDMFYERTNTLHTDCLEGVTLRDYQLDAAVKMLNARRGIARMATNSGKTEIIAALMYAIEPEGQQLMIVNSVDLMYQAQERLHKRLQKPIGVIGDGERDVQDITVAIVNSLANIPSVENVLEPVAIYIDECHHGASARYLELMQRLSGRFRYGFSGTPLNGDVLHDLQLISITGSIVYNLTNAELIDAGYSAKPVVKLHVIDNLWLDVDFQTAYEELIVSNTERNAKITELVRQYTDEVVLIIVSRIAHGKILQKLIPDSVFVSGSNSSEYRTIVLDNMRKYSGVYIATNIFDEGVDVPAISVLVMAAGGKSRRAVLQRIGRGLRVKNDGSGLVVHDFIDDTNDYLLDHSEERTDVYTAEGFDVTIEETSDS